MHGLFLQQGRGGVGGGSPRVVSCCAAWVEGPTPHLEALSSLPRVTPQNGEVSDLDPCSDCHAEQPRIAKIGQTDTPK